MLPTPFPYLLAIKQYNNDKVTATVQVTNEIKATI